MSVAAATATSAAANSTVGSRHPSSASLGGLLEVRAVPEAETRQWLDSQAQAVCETVSMEALCVFVQHCEVCERRISV